MLFPKQQTTIIERKPEWRDRKREEESEQEEQKMANERKMKKKKEIQKIWKRMCSRRVQCAKGLRT